MAAARTAAGKAAAAPRATRKPTRPPIGATVTAKAAESKSLTEAVAKRPSNGADMSPLPKIVRDSFTMPKTEYLVIEALKLRAARLGRPAKKSEVLRAGVAALQTMLDGRFLTALAAVPALKTGRPKASAEATSVASGKGGRKRRKSAL